MAVDPVLSAGLPTPQKHNINTISMSTDYLKKVITIHSCVGSGRVPVLTSLPFFGLKGAALGSATSFSLPFLRMGLSEGALLRDGREA